MVPFRVQLVDSIYAREVDSGQSQNGPDELPKAPWAVYVNVGLTTVISVPPLLMTNIPF